MYLEAANISRYHDISSLNRLTVKDSVYMRHGQSSHRWLECKGCRLLRRRGTDDLDRDDFGIDDWRRYKGTQKYCYCTYFSARFYLWHNFGGYKIEQLWYYLLNSLRSIPVKLVAWTERKGTYLLQSICAESMPTLCIYIYIYIVCVCRRFEALVFMNIIHMEMCTERMCCEEVWVPREDRLERFVNTCPQWLIP